jgi:uncharacterized RDD family membrane protein YckC
LISRLLSESPPSSPKATSPSYAPPVNPPADEVEAARVPTLDAEPAPAAEPAPLLEELTGSTPGVAGPARPWQEELAGRVESFRRRRARLKQDAGSSANLELDFEQTEDLDNLSPEEANFLEFPQQNTPLDVELGASARAEGELPILEAAPLEKPEGGLRILSSAAVEAGELTLEGEPASGEGEPVEIVVGAPEKSVQPASQEVSSLVLPLAPMGRRFLAGLADTLVLLVGASVFALVFWLVGGHLRLDSLNLAVLAVIAVFFILVYFGLFTALASSTPGLLWMECEVRNLEGAHPTTQESFLRAFGYLVSITALMLGFLWALLDSEGLTWHDRMSGTFIATEPAKPAVPVSEH